MARYYRKDGFRVKGRSQRDIRLVAETVRSELCRQDFKFLDVMRLLEHELPRRYPQFWYNIVPDDMLPGDEAQMDPRSCCIRIRESIYEMACNGDGHCRFTIAHEIGHFFLHRDQELAFASSATDGRVAMYENSEWQAETFARHLLVPYESARNMLPGAIQQIFGVSCQVADIVYREINGIKSSEISKSKEPDLFSLVKQW